MQFFLDPIKIGGKTKRPGTFTPGFRSFFEQQAPTYSNFPVIIANFNSPMALVIWISRGHAMVQLKTVWQRATPSVSLTIWRRSAADSSRLSKMKRWAVTSAAGPR
jgi:hypothetical protein